MGNRNPMQLKLTDFPARPVGAYYAPWSDRYADYFIEPKANGWRGWFNQKTKQGYNRHGKIASNENLMRELLSNCKIKSPWIDCEIMGMREKHGRNTIIIIDAFDPDNPKPYEERIKEFEHIQPASFNLQDNSLLRMPRLAHSKLKLIWNDMNFYNKHGGIIWEGFVMKKDKFYPALKNPNYASSQWHKWRMI